MDFDISKKSYLDKLYKPDRSTKGNVDEEIIPIIDEINSNDNYYTTSSCAGRILLIDVPRIQRKKDAHWQFVTHGFASYDDIKGNLKAGGKDRDVWFIQEPSIYHICARTLEDAQNIVDAAKECGLKRSGIFVTRKRFLVELVGCDKMEVPMASDENVVVSDEFIKTLVDFANKKMERRNEMNNLFLKKIKELKK